MNPNLRAGESRHKTAPGPYLAERGFTWAGSLATMPEATISVPQLSSHQEKRMLSEHEIEIRVRYQETDGQRRVHHANYLTYFEMGRIELLRAAGVCYKQLEETGTMLVVAEINCRYFIPAEYDDVLRLRTVTERTKGARIRMRHELIRGDQLLAEGRTVVACINQQGKVRLLPDQLIL